MKKYSLKKTKKKKKFRFLLEASFAHPFVFKHLRKKAILAHVRHTYNLSVQAEDKDVYQLAVLENRFVVTIDDDFKKLVKKDKSGVVIIPPYLSNEEIDKVLTEFISGKDPEDYKRKAIKV